MTWLPEGLNPFVSQYYLLRLIGKLSSFIININMINFISRLAEQLSLLSTPRPTDPTTAVIGSLPAECNARRKAIMTHLINSIVFLVLLQVFSHLDDLSLWSVSKVCKRWQQLVNESVTKAQWNEFTFRRWPLFRPNYVVADWSSVFSNL